MKIPATLLAFLFAFPFNTAHSAELNNAIEKGKQEFIDSCSICHGVNATGDGIFAALLTIPVPDLTQLKKTNKERFPFYEVYLTVDGRDQIRSHELMNMPMWGERFNLVMSRSVDESLSETYVRGQIFEIMLYLQSIQK